MNGKKFFQGICKRALLVIRFTCDGIEIIGTWGFTWTDLFLNISSLSLMIFYAANDMLQFILASSIIVRLPNLAQTCSA